MKKILLINIANLKSWLVETPNDEDYKRLLAEYEKELEKVK